MLLHNKIEAGVYIMTNRYKSVSFFIALSLIFIFSGCNNNDIYPIIEGYVSDEESYLLSDDNIAHELIQTSSVAIVTIEVVNIQPNRTITLNISNYTNSTIVSLNEIALGMRTLANEWNWFKIQDREYILDIPLGTTQTFQLYDVPFCAFIGKHIFRVPYGATQGELQTAMVSHNSQIQYGVYKLKMNVSVGENYSSLQSFEVYTPFQVDDPTIPVVAERVHLVASGDQHNGISIGIINLSKENHLYFGQYFRLYHYANGEWSELLQANNPSYDKIFSLYPRQSDFIFSSWSVLNIYPKEGMYRISKVFSHDSSNFDNAISYDIYFTLCLTPWTTRRKVVDIREGFLLAEPIPGSKDSHTVQQHHMHQQIWIRQYTEIFDMNGRPIQYYHIPIGAIVDILYGEGFLGWGNISEVFAIYVVEFEPHVLHDDRASGYETKWHHNIKRDERGRFLMPIRHEDLIIYATNEGIQAFNPTLQKSRVLVEVENVIQVGGINNNYLYFGVHPNSVYRMSLYSYEISVVHTHIPTAANHGGGEVGEMIGFKVLGDELYIRTWCNFECVFMYCAETDEFATIIENISTFAVSGNAVFFISATQRDASIYKKSLATGEFWLMRGGGVSGGSDSAGEEVFTRYNNILLIGGDIYYIANQGAGPFIGRMFDDSEARKSYSTFWAIAVNYPEQSNIPTNDIIIFDTSTSERENLRPWIYWFSDGTNLFYGYMATNDKQQDTVFIYKYCPIANKSVLLVELHDFYPRGLGSFAVFDNVLLFADLTDYFIIDI